MYQTLYRKWRPKNFDDVCGQEHVTSILRYEIMTQKTSHAYLFCGSRGTGKTTCAKLLSQALNCENPQNGSPCGVCRTCRGIASGQITDVIEMDAASNNGVDNIRDIREDVAYAPSECRKRVFIIDEVHMLSVSAFNALLKTLEEPPEHIVFILATTELHKIPATILSRCQRFDFRRIETGVIAARLRTIADAEGISIEDDALFLIAKLANGGMRDAIGMLELCAGNGGQASPMSERDVAALIGTSPMETTAALVRAITKKDYACIFETVNSLYKEARDIGVFWQSLISIYRDMLVIKTVPNPAAFLDLPEKQRALPAELAKAFSMETLLCHTRILDEVLSVLQKNTAPGRITVEMALLRLCDTTLDTSYEALLARIAALEDKVALGITSPVPAAVPQQTEPTGTTAMTASAPVQEKPSSETTEAAPQPAVSSPQKAEPSAPSQSGGTKKVLQAFRQWQDAVRRVEKSNPMIGSFLRNYKAYICEADGQLYLHAPESFSVSLVTEKENLSQLCSAVNIVSGRKPFAESQIVIETRTKAQQSGYEMIDDLIESAGETAE